MSEILPGRAEHAKQLAEELLEDIELQKMDLPSLILKTQRLSRLVDNQNIREWLNYEISGYPNTDTGQYFMTITGRWINRSINTGFWAPIAQIEGMIDGCRRELDALRIPDISVSAASSNQYQHVHVENPSVSVNSVINRCQALNNQMNQLLGIRSRVMGYLHTFVANIYYQLAFSGIAEELFESFKSDVDSLLADSCGSVLEKLPFVYARLHGGEPEDISQALNTSRRIIDSFSDSVFPPQTEPYISSGGESWEVTTDKCKNRINAFIDQKCHSSSQKTKLRKMLASLYERTSAGVHSEVSTNEAQAIILGLYLFMGEVIRLKTEIHS